MFDNATIKLVGVGVPLPKRNDVVIGFKLLDCGDAGRLFLMVRSCQTFMRVGISDNDVLENPLISWLH